MKAECASDCVKAVVELEGERIGAVADMGEPLGAADDAVELIAVDDQKALAKTVRTYPKTGFYDLEVALTSLEGGGDARFPIAPRMSTDSLYALRTATLMGVGAAIVSAWLVADDLAQGRLVHLAPRWRAAPLPVWLVYPQARFYPARLRRFLDVIRAHAAHALAPKAPGG